MENLWCVFVVFFYIVIQISTSLYLRLTFCPVKGTSTPTWRRCWGTSPAAGRCLSAGWSGSLMSRPGTPTSTLSCATRKWTKLAPFTSDISFCWCFHVCSIYPLRGVGVRPNSNSVTSCLSLEIHGCLLPHTSCFVRPTVQK